MIPAKARVRQRRQLEKQAANKAIRVFSPKSEWNNEFKPLFQSNFKKTKKNVIGEKIKTMPNCHTTASETSPINWNYIKYQIFDK
jgi:hypothetical protein